MNFPKHSFDILDIDFSASLVLNNVSDLSIISGVDLFALAFPKFYALMELYIPSRAQAF